VRRDQSEFIHKERKITFSPVSLTTTRKVRRDTYFIYGLFIAVKNALIGQTAVKRSQMNSSIYYCLTPTKGGIFSPPALLKIFEIAT